VSTPYSALLRPDPRYEPDAIRAVVPLQWALGVLLGQWDLGLGMHPCPFHDEASPSFGLFAADDRGLPQRYHCFGCGRAGDVIDLIRKTRDVGFDEACRLAVEELAPQVGNWTPMKTFPVKRTASPEALEGVLGGLGPMDASGLAVLLRFLESKEMGGEALARFAVEDWGWLGKAPALVCIPHRNWQGRLIGLRYRAALGDARWSEEGSTFPSPYGAWRDQGHQQVLLAEGEGDTVFAAFQLRDRPIDVVGLVGADQRPTDEIRERLKGRTVYIAGDGDDAGARANRTWIDAGIAMHVIWMPEGQDIVSCGIAVADLLERAEVRERRRTPGL
jgi:hypothetical protein